MQLSHYAFSPIQTEWDTQLMGAAIDLYRGIWEDRNKMLHGDNRRDHLVYLWNVIQEQVRLIYKYPPKLHKKVCQNSKNYIGGKTISEYCTLDSLVKSD